jgi:hypothetical protein
MDVSINYRDIFSVASVFVAMNTFYSENFSCSISRVIKIADLGILLGSDATSISALQSIIRELTSVAAKSQSVLASPPITSSRKRSRYEYNNSYQCSGSILDPIIDLDDPIAAFLVETVSNPSVLKFYESNFLKTKPVVLKESIADWPAMQAGRRAWSNLQNIIVGKQLSPPLFQSFSYILYIHRIYSNTHTLYIQWQETARYPLKQEKLI